MYLFKKGLAILMVAALVVTVFAGCSKPAPTAAAVPAKDVTAKELMKDVNIRKALTLAIDRTAIVETVTKGGQVPATGFVPAGLKDSTGKDFRATNGDFGIDPAAASVDEAKKILADAGYPDGKGFPKLTIIYNTSENHKAIAEAVQEMWKTNLNIDVELQNQEWAVFQDTRHQGNFEVARAGWIGDYEDPMTFLDLWTTYSGNNDAHWYRTDYDKLIEESKLASGADRDAKLYAAEKMLMDDMIVMPIYYYTQPIIVAKRVKDWELSMLGHFYFGKASTDNGKMTFNLASDPKTLDPTLNSAADGGHVINNLYEGLMRKDESGASQPGIAEKYEVSADGKTYTFHLRDSKWSDGKPVTAGDFEYAWKRALDPATASEYAFQLYYVKGGQEFNEGKGKIEDVAVKAIDDKTLQVELISPTPYFLDLTGFYTYMPIRKDMVEKDPDNWAKNPATALSNGPFKMKDYKTGDRIVLAKNENYWNNSIVKLDQIDILMIVDASTSLTAVEAGEIDVVDSMGIPNQEIPRLTAESDTFKIMPYIGTYYFIFNVGDTK